MACTEDEATQWIIKVTGEHVDDLFMDIKDGVLLCKLVNTFQPRLARYKQSKMPFVQMENIASFLDAISRVGVDDRERFVTVDLYENKNPKQVLLTIMALSRLVYSRGLTNVEPIGPKLATPNLSPTPIPPRHTVGVSSKYNSPNVPRPNKYGYVTSTNNSPGLLSSRREIVTPPPPGLKRY